MNQHALSFLLQNRRPVFCLGVFLAFIFAFALDVKGVEAVEPPASAECSQTNESAYQCDGSVPEGAVQIQNAIVISHPECLQTCQDGGGVLLRYGRPERGAFSVFCLGAAPETQCTSDSGVFFLGGGASLNLATGEEESKCSNTNIGCWLEKILDGLKLIGGTILIAVLGIIANLLGFVFVGISQLLSWVVEGLSSVTVSPAHPDTIAIVKDGWGISRDLANMFFVLIFVFIGLATILRIPAYEAKKTLPTLLLVILLVNFSGVLVGFVVDIGNLATNFFLQQTRGLQWAFGFPGGSSSVADIAYTAAGHLARIIFYIVASLIYLAVAFLFFVRILFLWTLAILAPLAFAAYVLPATRGFWKRWWSQLIQWTLLGVPMAFFMYLARLALEPVVQDSLRGVGGTSNPLAAFMGPFVALFLLFFGITLSMEFAPAGAKAALGIGTAVGAGAGLLVGAGLWRKLEGSNIQDGGGRISRLGTRLQGLTQAPEGAGTLRRGLATGLKRSGAGLITGMAGRGIELAAKEATMRLGTRDSREQKEAEALVGNKDSFSVFNMINEKLAAAKLGKPVDWNGIIGLLNGVRNRGDGDDIEKALKTVEEGGSGTLKKELLAPAIKAGMRTGPPGFRPLTKSFFGPIFADPRAHGFDADTDDDGNILGVTFDEKGKAVAGTYKDKDGNEKKAGKDAKWLAEQRKSLPQKFNTEDFKGDTLAKANFDIDPDNPRNPEKKAARIFLENVIEQRDADLMPQLLRRPDKQERNNILKYIFEDWKGSKELTIDHLAINAPGALRYITSTAARGAGIGIGLEPNEVERIIKEAMEKNLREQGRRGIPPSGTASGPRRPTGPGQGPMWTPVPPPGRRPTGPRSGTIGEAPRPPQRRATGPGGTNGKGPDSNEPPKRRPTGPGS